LPQPFGLAFHFDQKSLESCNLRDPSACGTILKILRRKNSVLAAGGCDKKMRTHYLVGQKCVMSVALLQRFIL